MNRIAIAALLVVCSPAFATDFASRVAEAKQATATPEGAQYDGALGPFIGAAMQACVPPGSTDPKNLGSFTLVGYVTAAGALHSVAVEPQTKVSSCFVERFRKSTLPNPPRTTQGNIYPIVVEMKVTP